MNEQERTFRTEYLGRYDDFEAQVVIDILADHGITAMRKLPLEENELSYYPSVHHEHGEVLVEAGRAAEARAILEGELPEHLAAIQASMDQMELASEDGASEGVRGD